MEILSLQGQELRTFQVKIEPTVFLQIINTLVPTDSESKWDFSLYEPNIVVINLLQNDSWLVNLPEHKEFKAKFGDKALEDVFLINTYQEFVSSIRKHYPDAKIICALGNMDATIEESVGPDYIVAAVANLNDKNAYTHYIPYKDTPGHPS